jgi:hypothetical protein
LTGPRKKELRVTDAKLAALVYEIAGLVGSGILTFSSFSFEKNSSTWFAEAYEAEQEIIDRRNRWRISWAAIGFATLFASYVIQVYVTLCL